MTCTLIAPRRPHYNDDVVRQQAAQLLLPDVRTWLEAHGDHASLDEEILRDLASALQYKGLMPDGFELAQELDSKGWAPDTALVEILDGGKVVEALSVIVKKWVIANAIKIDIPLGASVTNGSITGTVIKHYPETAECVVQRPLDRDGAGVVLPTEKLTVQ